MIGIVVYVPFLTILVGVILGVIPPNRVGVPLSERRLVAHCYLAMENTTAVRARGYTVQGENTCENYLLTCMDYYGQQYQFYRECPPGHWWEDDQQTCLDTTFSKRPECHRRYCGNNVVSANDGRACYISIECGLGKAHTEMCEDGHLFNVTSNSCESPLLANGKPVCDRPAGVGRLNCQTQGLLLPDWPSWDLYIDQSHTPWEVNVCENLGHVYNGELCDCVWHGL